MYRDPAATTVRFLFALDWAAPAGDGGWNVRVPGGKVAGPDVAVNLLNVAFWSLREQELVELQQIRPVEEERVMALGGRSFVRVMPLEAGLALAGLEGALLRQVNDRGAAPSGAWTRFSRDDPLGLRGIVYALGLPSGSPWNGVVQLCRDAARGAGLVEIHGRFVRKPEITPDAPLDALRERDAEIVAARTDYKQREPDLDNATFADCAAALDWAHTSS